MSGCKRTGKGEPSAISPLVGEMSGRTEGGKPLLIRQDTPLCPYRGISPTRGEIIQKPSLDDMGRDVATSAGRTSDKSLFRKNTLDEMTVGRTEKPVTGHVPEKPILTRAKPGIRSYEEPAEEKRQKRSTKGKTGSGAVIVAP